MTENKRFDCTENGFVVDYESEQKVLNLYDTVDILNQLNDENEELKKVINEADDLIKSHLTNHYKRRWKNICEYYGVEIE